MTCSEQSSSSLLQQNKTSNMDEAVNKDASAAAVWCPEEQIYIGGVVPSTHTSPSVSSLLEQNGGSLRIFGYGSLCWNPGEGAVLSQKQVTRSLGRAIGWRRCWSQKSADHRGTPFFSGIVCTLLSDAEVYAIQQQANITSSSSTTTSTSSPPSMIEGMIYQVPPALAQECLAELDFREKGGYARDVIDVLDDTTGETVRALLYRGTPENPAFWKRALLDLPFAAATMSVSVGPSGPNDAYLYNLDTFLTDASTQLSLSDDDHMGDADTRILANMTRTIQLHQNVYFLFGAGSNQHGQLALWPDAAPLKETNNGEDVGVLTELVLAVPKHNDKSHNDSPSSATSTMTTTTTTTVAEEHRHTLSFEKTPLQLYAGGGHSALLTSDGHLYLWGWNDKGQLGRGSHNHNSNNHNSNKNDDNHDDTNGNVASSTTSLQQQQQQLPIPTTPPLANIHVSKAALGHSHTLVIEKETGYVYAFGDNERGQLGIMLPEQQQGTNNNKNQRWTSCHEPTIPTFLQNIPCMDIAAGLFHSAVITKDEGALLTFGCGKFGQCLPSRRGWKPKDGSRLVQVKCGRRHTMVLDEFGRVWTLGHNGYGQLGRQSSQPQPQQRQGQDVVDGGVEEEVVYPQLVDGILGEKHNGCVRIDCGWSHCIALVQPQPPQQQEQAGSNSNDQTETTATTAATAESLTKTKSVLVYGWGRNDKGQLGITNNATTNSSNETSKFVSSPRLLHDSVSDKNKKKNIIGFYCGAESSMAMDEEGGLWGCGWNEHGNLGIGSSDDGGEGDVYGLTKVVGAHMPRVNGAGKDLRRKKQQQQQQKEEGKKVEKLVAVGGAHFLTMIA